MFYEVVTRPSSLSFCELGAGGGGGKTTEQAFFPSRTLFLDFFWTTRATVFGHTCGAKRKNLSVKTEPTPGFFLTPVHLHEKAFETPFQTSQNQHKWTMIGQQMREISWEETRAELLDIGSAIGLLIGDNMKDSKRVIRSSAVVLQKLHTFSNHMRFDLMKAVATKQNLNETRYPVDVCLGLAADGEIKTSTIKQLAIPRETAAARMIKQYYGLREIVPPDLARYWEAYEYSRTFVKLRNWEDYESRHCLGVALVAEFGELASVFAHKTNKLTIDAGEFGAIVEEAADCFLFAVRILGNEVADDFVAFRDALNCKHG